MPKGEKLRRFFLLWGGGVLGIFAAAARAQEAPSVTLSTVSLRCDFLEFRSLENVGVARGNAVAVSSETILSADEMTLYLSSQVVVSRGHVVLFSSGTRLEADEMVLDQQTQEAVAVGHVFLEDNGLSVLSEKVRYHWGNATGTFEHVFVQQGPWRMWGKTLERLGPTRYRLQRAAFSSCPLDPPHYHFRASSAEFRVGERLSAWNLRPVVEGTTFLYCPYYTRSLRNNRWTYTVDPGHSARNGSFLKNVFTYPLGDVAKISALADFYSRAGTGLGAELTYSSSTVRGSASAYAIRDRIDDTRRWNLRLSHWQRLTDRWQAQSRVVLQSDQKVNDQLIGDDDQRLRQKGESNLAFTRTGSWYTGRISAQHTLTYQTAQQRFVTAQSILPRMEFQSSALRWGASKAYVRFGGNFWSQYDRPADPIDPSRDRVRRHGDVTGSFSWQRPLTKTLSLEPVAGFSENWESRLLSPLPGTDASSVLVARPSGGLNVRHRLLRSLDYDVRYQYAVRWRANSVGRDHRASDRGIEKNALAVSASYRPSSAVWGRVASGYDFRDTLGERTARERFTSPSLEWRYRPRSWCSVNGRETVRLAPTRKRETSAWDFRLGPDEKTFFSSGFSYNLSRPGALDLTQAFAFQWTRGWWVSGQVQSTLLGSGGTRYNRIDWKEKNWALRRDLHCWVVRVSYKERPGVQEIFVRLDLKAGLDIKERVARFDEKQYYPGRDLSMQ